MPEASSVNKMYFHEGLRHVHLAEMAEHSIVAASTISLHRGREGSGGPALPYPALPPRRNRLGTSFYFLYRITAVRLLRQAGNYAPQPDPVALGEFTARTLFVRFLIFDSEIIYPVPISL